MELTEEAREARREYMKRWRANNQDKTREYNRRFWAKRAGREASGRRNPAASGECENQ